MNFRLLRGRGTGLAAVTLGLALLVTPLALAGDDRGEPVEIELRNRSAGETGLVTASDEYSLRLSNTKEGGGGGAVYGCRAPDAAPRRNLACLYADNLRGGKAFLFRSRDGDSVGHFDIGDPANPPFTTNARGLVQNLNAEMVGGLTAQQLIARAPAEARPGATGPQGPAGPAGATGATGPRGPSDAFVAHRDNSASAVSLPPFVDVQIATVEVPAGSFLLSAKVELGNNSGALRSARCELTLGGTQVDLVRQQTDATNGPVGESVPLLGAGTTEDPAEATLTCRGFGSGLSTDVTTLAATQVENLTLVDLE